MVIRRLRKVAGGGFDVMDAEKYGEPAAVDEVEEMDVSEDDGCDRLFFLSGPCQSLVCCGAISSGQGTRRFCTLTMKEGEKTCGVGSHSVKAKVAENSFFVKTKVKGGSGALSSKTMF